MKEWPFLLFAFVVATFWLLLSLVLLFAHKT